MTRPITPDDLWSIPRVDRPVASADGTAAVVPVTFFEIDADEVFIACDLFIAPVELGVLFLAVAPARAASLPPPLAFFPSADILSIAT